MSRSHRVVLLTGDQRRHRYAAGRLAEQLDLLGVVAEAKYSPRRLIEAAAPADRAVMFEHFQERDRVEADLLGSFPPNPARHQLPIAHAGLDQPEVFEWVQRLRPEYLILYGCSILRGPLFREYAGRIVNLHLGLAPYYRGSGTNFWPLVNRQPECVGATLHLAVEVVDAGPILGQIRPPVEPADRIHHLGTKALKAVLGTLPEAIVRLAGAPKAPTAQDPSRGRLYRRKDFSAQAVRTAWAHLNSGMIPEYLEARELRDQAFPIIEIGAAGEDE